MKAPLALTLAALASATTMSQAQISVFSYVGDVVEIKDDLGLFGSAVEGSEGTGSFTLDFDAQSQGGNPQGGDLIGYFEALGLNAVLGEFDMGGASPEDTIIAFATDNLSFVINEDDETITVDTLEISLGFGFGDNAEFDWGYINIIFTGTEDWFDTVGDTVPDPLSMGFENLLNAEVIIEFFQIQGGNGGDGNPGDGDGGGGGSVISSRAVIDINSMANADGTVATIGCRSYQFAAPVAVFNFVDVSAFVSSFQAQSSNADLNGDGILNFFDVSTFIGMAQTGCSN